MLTATIELLEFQWKIESPTHMRAPDEILFLWKTNIGRLNDFFEMDGNYFRNEKQEKVVTRRSFTISHESHGYTNTLP